MKRFLRDLIITLLIFLSMDYFAVPGFISASARYLRDDYFKLEPADVLFLGDSHGSFAFDPDLCAESGLKCLNYSYGGHYWEFNYYFYKRYRAEAGRPKQVVISTPFFSFKNDTELRDLHLILDPETIREFLYAPEARKLSTYAASLYRLEPNLFRYREILSQGTVIGFLKTLTGTQHPVRYVGYATHGNPKFSTYDLSQNRSLSMTPPNNVKKYDLVNSGYLLREPANQRNTGYFRKLLALLAEDGVQVYLSETPEFIGTQESVLGNDTFYGEIKREIAPYSNTTLIRQSEIREIDSRDPKLFFDGGYGSENSHLSMAGSQVYTRAILRRLASH